jgi:hypothetical protein
MYSVWTQIVDDYTTPENIDAFGSVHDVFAEQEDDDTGTPNKQFCDGQTSKTPPRYAQDNMVGIYTRSEESAQIISDFLRQDVQSRILSGSLVAPLPSWYAIAGTITARETALLRLRMLYEFRRVPESDIIAALDEIIASGIDNMTVSRIIQQMRGRLT